MTPQTRTDMPVIIFMMMLVLAFVLIADRYANANQVEVTCEQVKQAAVYTGHKDPRHIAHALGLKLTDAQLAEAARCLQLAKR